MFVSSLKITVCWYLHVYANSEAIRCWKFHNLCDESPWLNFIYGFLASTCKWFSKKHVGSKGFPSTHQTCCIRILWWIGRCAKFSSNGHLLSQSWWGLPASSRANQKYDTVEPPNNGQIGSGHFVLYMEVVFCGKLEQLDPELKGYSIHRSITLMVG